jgi:hypothetical protein
METAPEGTMGFSEGFQGALDDGTLLTTSDGILDISGGPGPAWYRHFVHAIDPAGGSRDTVGEFAFTQRYWDGSRQQQYWYAPNAFLLPYGEDLLHAPGTTYEYRILRRDGSVKRVVRRAFTPQPVEATDVDAVMTMMFANARRFAGPERLPEIRRQLEATPRASHKPPYSSILVDDERNIWVERFRWMNPWSVPADPQPTTWDVFTADGEWLTEVTVPAGVLLLSVAADRVYGARIDAMDVRHVVVYGLNRDAR